MRRAGSRRIRKGVREIKGIRVGLERERVRSFVDRRKRREETSQKKGQMERERRFEAEPRHYEACCDKSRTYMVSVV